MVEEPRRRGPRADGTDTRSSILAAARAEFSAKGFDAVSVRAIARSAGVDPALVRHYFGSKEELLIASLQLPVNPVELIAGVAAGGIDGVGERLLRTMLAVWDVPEHAERLAVLGRAAINGSLEGLSMRQLVLGPMLGRLTSTLGCSRPQWSAELVATQVVGLLVARYLLRVEPLASAPTEDVVAAIAPTIQRYLELN